MLFFGWQSQKESYVGTIRRSAEDKRWDDRRLWDRIYVEARIKGIDLSKFVTIKEATRIMDWVASRPGDENLLNAWAQMQQLQSQIFQITQDVTVNKANTADRTFNAMAGYIRN